MNKLMQMKAAMAMEKASESEGGSGMGMGTGLGLMLPAMFAQYFAGAQPRSDQDQPESKELLFFPYWRFKGMLFSCAGNGLAHKFVDVSHQAVLSHLFPVSLGLRSQALKLKFVKPDTAGRFLKPTQSFEDVKQNFEDRFGKSLPKPVLHHAHISETLSLIYAPFYMQNRLYDAVLDRPIAAAPAENFDIDQLPAESPDWRIHFISTLCPHCGWDLDGEKASLVLLCKNCTSAWYPVGKKLKTLSRFLKIYNPCLSLNR